MDDQNLIIETFEELSPRYQKVVDAELNLFWGWRYSDFVNTLLGLTPIHPEDRILDIATGTGVIPTNIATRNPQVSSLHGLDITHAMLKHAQTDYNDSGLAQPLRLTCASAMSMPYARDSFSLVFCGLATHHMEVDLLISEMYRVLDKGGRIAVADAGSSPLWKIPGVKLMMRMVAYLYFLFKENSTRAWAEALAVSNVRTKEEWEVLLSEVGFNQIKIRQLKSKYRWVPDPLVIYATKLGVKNDKIEQFIKGR